MSDEIGKRRLHSRLLREDEDAWSIITEIADLEESRRRRLLRPHAEKGFGNDNESIEAKRKRLRLDVALGALTTLEIAYETGVVTEKEEPVPKSDHLRVLFESEAFLRYVNAYLYFGIRFLAWRIMPPEWDTVDKSKTLQPRNSNQQPFQLKNPPDLKDDNADSKFAVLAYLTESCDPAIHPQTNISQAQALSFLDGFTEEPNDTNTPKYGEDSASNPDRFELWLRGLSPKPTKGKELIEENRFWTITKGLIEWAIARRDFYLSLEEEGRSDTRPPWGWVVSNPLVARFALADVYWISHLLKAEVSTNASVTYSPSNWLHLLRFRLGLSGEEEQGQGKPNLQPELDLQSELWKAEEVLRSVFDFVCDLIQNAVEITEEKEKQAYEPKLFTRHPEETAKWRKVFDQELNEISRQRDLREFKSESSSASGSSGGSGGGNKVSREDEDWMERIRKRKPTHDLVGLSFSGGGIRSATFNLGVLQGLQELDLLRKIDFISTVSGGGFIGSWLVANVYNTKHWLGRLMNWEDSINHLRRYSNYLAPRLGMFSGDSWTMWASWGRNAFLIQLTCLVWLWTVLLAALLWHRAFLEWGTTFFFLLAIGLMGIVWLTLVINLSGNRAVSDKPEGIKPWPESKVLLLAILPTWCFSFLLASRMWAGVTTMASGKVIQPDLIQQIESHSRIASRAISSWPLIIWFALFFLAFSTLSRLRRQTTGYRVPRKYPLVRRLFHAAWMSGSCVFVLFHELKGILWIFMRWSENGPRSSWYAYVLGPPLVLAAHTISVILLIGFCGRHSKEAIREWWTRFGATLAMFATAYLALTTVAVFGPPWILYLLGLGAVKWGSIISWIATVIGGLLAGKSSRTSGKGSHTKSRWLERLAKVGGFVFIVGAVLVASTALFVVLAKIGAPDRNWVGYWETVDHIGLRTKGIAFVACLVLGILFSLFFEINIFGLNQFYRFRLVRCYIGATRWASGFRKPQPFTNFDGDDDITLSELSNDPENRVTSNNRARAEGYRGPFPIFNCALNLSGSSDLALHTRHSASFSLTPLWCGADRRRVGYAPTQRFADGIMLGQAVSISGAAASPNMGFNTSPLVAFLLTMFNVRLGWWFPNPGKWFWDYPGLNFSLYYLLRELFGVADEKSWFVNVSDGGHFENLGVYELIRRRCKVIIVSDAECDEFLQFGSLGNLVRICETDFGAKIDIDVNSMRQQKGSFSLAHSTVGHVFYSNGSMGYIIYLKSSMTGDEDVGITQYRSLHPSFPHETTADQFFSEDQFESYRRLGLHTVRESLRGSQPGDHPVSIAEKLADVLAPSGCSSEAFLKHSKTLDRIWERFRETPELYFFFEELMRQTISATAAPPHQTVPPTRVRNEEAIIGLELIQLMENVFLDLRLDDFWSHPDNRGWAILFMRWARSPRFRAIWKTTHRTFGIRFEYFCEARLGLSRDKPIVRV